MDYTPRIIFDLRPAGVTSGAFALTDAGKCVYATGNVTIPNATMRARDVIVINNTTSSAINITAAVSTLRLAGTDNTGNFQLAAYGIANVLFESPTLAKISGTGLSVAYDADAQAFFTAAGITTTAAKEAVSTFVASLKSASLWTKMRAIYPFVQNSGGTSLTPHSYNLKNPAAFQITWSGTPVASDNGVTGDGSGYGDTGLNLLADTTANSLSFGYYSRTDGTGAADMGCYTGSEGCEIYADLGGTAYFDNQLNGGAGRCSAAVTDALGLFTSSRTAGNAAAGYKRGASIASTSGAQGTRVSNTFKVFQQGLGIGGTLTTRNLAFAFIGDGLTSGEVSSFYSSVQALQTALGRAV